MNILARPVLYGLHRWGYEYVHCPDTTCCNLQTRSSFRVIVYRRSPACPLRPRAAACLPDHELVEGHGTPYSGTAARLPLFFPYL